MISIRVSEGEYAAMQACCTRYGARNLSDFARLAVQQVMSGSIAPDTAVLIKVRELEARVDLVEACISRFVGAGRQ